MASRARVHAAGRAWQPLRSHLGNAALCVTMATVPQTVSRRPDMHSAHRTRRRAQKKQNRTAHVACTALRAKRSGRRCRCVCGGRSRDGGHRRQQRRRSAFRRCVPINGAVSGHLLSNLAVALDILMSHPIRGNTGRRNAGTSLPSDPSRAGAWGALPSRHAGRGTAPHLREGGRLGLVGGHVRLEHVHTGSQRYELLVAQVLLDTGVVEGLAAHRLAV